MKKVLLSSVLAAPFALAAGASPASAQSAAEVFASALERYEASVEGIDRYTTVQEVMGMDVTLTFEKQVIDGHPVFVPVGEGESSDFTSPIQYFPRMAERARMEGREEVAGERCYILAIDDFSGLDFGEMAAGQEGEFTPREGRFFIGSDSYLMRKMVLEGDVRTDGETSPFEVEALMDDWRQVEGMWHPFLVTVRTLGAIPGMSEDDIEEARQAMAEMEEQLAEMPASQRAMAERMMGGQMERLREMLESGSFEMTIVTKELRVNEGGRGPRREEISARAGEGPRAGEGRRPRGSETARVRDREGHRPRTWVSSPRRGGSAGRCTRTACRRSREGSSSRSRRCRRGRRNRSSASTNRR